MEFIVSGNALKTLQAPSSQKGRWENLILAYKTLGVVFGGLVRSPLYVYPSRPLKPPTKEDYLGIYSIMFWTLTLIGVAKYDSIALKADDQGEGVVVSMVMPITTILLTLVMIMILRALPLMVALYLVFFTMEGVYVSAVFTKIPEGGWIPFAISFFLAFIMFGWFYGRQRKIEYELTHKIDLGRLRKLLSAACFR